MKYKDVVVGMLRRFSWRCWAEIRARPCRLCSEDRGPVLRLPRRSEVLEESVEHSAAGCAVGSVNVYGMLSNVSSSSRTDLPIMANRYLPVKVTFVRPIVGCFAVAILPSVS
jgi:hypothetical protein